MHCAAGCGDAWCGEDCARMAEQHGHAAVCHLLRSVEGSGDAAAAAGEFMAVFGRTNERFMLLLRLIARLCAECERAGGGVCRSACVATLERYADGDLAAARLGRDGRRAVAQCAALLRSALPDLAERHPAMLRAQTIVRALNVFDVNCHTAFSLSPLYGVMRWMSSGRAAALRVDGGAGAPKSDVEQLVAAADPALLHAPAVALYQVAACLNHSCRPNCKLKPPSGAVRAEVYALRDLVAEEELTISYIDEVKLAGQPFTRAAAVKSYGFTCDCAACDVERSLHASAWCAAAVLCLVGPRPHPVHHDAALGATDD
eukprot:TRINITY_DN15698_c0_g1_i4.p2 TRINITY_DN15698_c0_g1~~TRINITY_DN15698_c0_g1_i4.p2  ORF type:complete len:316 (+),score=93.48 TRINITY_DN15698_c0_g1_i4:412-1359(+)